MSDQVPGLKYNLRLKRCIDINEAKGWASLFTFDRSTDETYSVSRTMVPIKEAEAWLAGEERQQPISRLVNCGHPAGCKCERATLAKVPCGQDTLALCRAALRVRDGRWYKGAATHIFAEFLRELANDGYVLARPEDPGQTT